MSRLSRENTARNSKEIHASSSSESSSRGSATQAGGRLSRAASAGSILIAPHALVSPHAVDHGLPPGFRERFGATTRSRAIAIWERRAFGSGTYVAITVRDRVWASNS